MKLRHGIDWRMAVLVGAMVALATISVPAASAVRSEKAVTTLRVAYATAAQADFYYALRTNMFKRFGLQVKGIPFANGTELVTALVAGSVDVGFLGMPPVIFSNANEAGLQVFRVGLDVGAMDSLYVGPKSGVRSVADLAGKTVATTRGSQSDVLLHYALQRAGVDWSSVRFQYFAPPALVAGYARGDFDIVWTFNTPGAQLLALGARMITNAHRIGMADPASYAAKKDFIQSRKADLVAFSRALDAAAKRTKNANVWVSAVSHGSGLTPDQARIAAKYLLDGTPSSAQLIKPRYILSLTPGGGWARLAQKEVSTMTAMGLLASPPPPVGTMVTSVIAAAAAKGNT